MHIFWQVPHFLKIFLRFTILAWTRWFSRIPQFSTIFSLTFRSSSYRHKLIGEVLPRLRFLITNITIFNNFCRHVTSNVNWKYSCYLNHLVSIHELLQKSRKIWQKTEECLRIIFSILGVIRKVTESVGKCRMLSYRFWELSEGCDGRIVNLRNLQNKVKQHMNQQWFHIDVVFSVLGVIRGLWW